MRRVVSLSLAMLLAYLSIPVVQNLLSPRQAMNTSFDPLRILNTYGAFGRCGLNEWEHFISVLMDEILRVQIVIANILRTIKSEHQTFLPHIICCIRCSHCSVHIGSRHGL